jgi:hypothetical protein
VEQQLQQSKEIVRLVDIGVLEEEYSSEWASIFSWFAIIKKNGTIRVATNFKTLKLLLRNEMSTISYSKDWETILIRSVEGFTFASALDKNMGYYHVKLDADAQNYVWLYAYG